MAQNALSYHYELLQIDQLVTLRTRKLENITNNCTLDLFW